MKTSIVDLRRHFLQKYGRASFEAISIAFADVQGDSSQVLLSSIPAWREFAVSMSVVPRSDLVPKVFLWCIRHSQSLRVIDRPELPAWLDQINHSVALQKLLVRNPFAFAASPNALRCVKCFDNAARRAMQLDRKAIRRSLPMANARPVKHP